MVEPLAGEQIRFEFLTQLFAVKGTGSADQFRELAAAIWMRVSTADRLGRLLSPGK